MRPSKSAPAKASQRIAATNEGSTTAIIGPGTNTRERGETTYSGGDEPRRRASDRHQRTGGIPSPGRLLPEVLRRRAGPRAQPALLLTFPSAQRRGATSRRLGRRAPGGVRHAVLVLQLHEGGRLGVDERPVCPRGRPRCGHRTGADPERNRRGSPPWGGAPRVVHGTGQPDGAPPLRFRPWRRTKHLVRLRNRNRVTGWQPAHFASG